MDLEFRSDWMAQSSAESGTITKSMAMESFGMSMAMYMKATGQMMPYVGMEYTYS